MKKFLGFLGFIIIFTQLFACTPKPPYEIKSPCVSSGEGLPASAIPCPRKHMNFDWDIV